VERYEFMKSLLEQQAAFDRGDADRAADFATGAAG
jgi:hypothetical protein